MNIKLNCLLKLSKDKKIDYSEEHLKNATEEELDRILKEYKTKQECAVLNEYLSISVIKGVVSGLKMFNTIENHQELEKELLENKLLKRDLQSTISVITPWIPYTGYFSGLITITKYLKVSIELRKTAEQSWSDFLWNGNNDDGDDNNGSDGGENEIHEEEEEPAKK